MMESKAVPNRAMVLAAGLGLRMRPITLTTPKSLIKVGGRAMLDQALDRLQEVGVDSVVVNTHWLRRKVELHLKTRDTPTIKVSPETELLETGGGVANALPILGADPFFIINADIVWRDGTKPALYRLAQAWDWHEMDALLLLVPTVRPAGYSGKGDFFMDALGRLKRRPEREIAPYVFGGVQIVHPRIFESAPTPPFSMNVLYDRSINKDRLYGLVHDAGWYHVGTPQELKTVEAELLEREGARVRQLY
ncbi:MAG: nucleotidyltransferase family protein [Pseudomonadota bacterium]|nr:nucleotidyltransferase family protein [Pseudomonadota bacterium]